MFFNNGTFIKKEIDDEVFDFYLSNNKVIYLKNDLTVKKIEIAMENISKPEIINIETKKSKLKIELSNFNLDYNFYKTIELEIAEDENFNNIVKTNKIDEYSKYTDKQIITLDNNFEKDKKLYLRLRYLDIFKRKSKWSLSHFVVLGEKTYPEVELLSPKNEEIFKDFPFNIIWKNQIDFSYNIIIAKDEFFQNIVKEFYYLENNKQEIKYLEAGEYFLKIYYKDKFDRKSKEKIIKFYIQDRKSSSGCSF